MIVLQLEFIALWQHTRPGNLFKIGIHAGIPEGIAFSSCANTQSPYALVVAQLKIDTVRASGPIAGAQISQTGSLVIVHDICVQAIVGTVAQRNPVIQIGAGLTQVRCHVRPPSIPFGNRNARPVHAARIARDDVDHALE